MKDIEWLKERVEKLDKETSQNYPHEEMVELPSVLRCIDQLDELEVEENCYTFDNSKKWLEDNGFVAFEKDKLDAEVQRMIDETYKTMNEKPVIPKFVADLMEDYNDASIQSFLSDAFRNYREGRAERADTWITKNPADFVDAYRYGYTVEGKKYYVRNKSGQRMLVPFFGEISDVFVSEDVILNKGKEEAFTEQEIKDYDERYFAFAVPVEELEE